jgi:hypothetical protein
LSKAVDAAQGPDSQAHWASFVRGRGYFFDGAVDAGSKTSAATSPAADATAAAENSQT